MQDIDRRLFLTVAGAAAGASPAAQAAQTGALTVTGLLAEQIDQPLGLETERPRLSWRLESPRRDLRQGAWRITAASSLEALVGGRPDLWDSGRRASDRCFDIAYEGRAPKSGERVWWRVQAWDASGEATGRSAPSWFEMGLLAPADWRADWLTAIDAESQEDRAAGLYWIWGEQPLDPRAQKFRFVLEAPEGGHGELLLSAKDELKGVWLNGAALPLPEEAAAWGTMARFPLPLSAGRNVLCVEARADTTGFFPVDGGAVAALLKIRTPAGRTIRLTSGPAWRTSNLEAEGWTAPGYDDRAWGAAVPSKAHVHNEPWPAGPAMLLRKGFQIRGPVARARLYATALGAYEARLNGARVGDARLSPEITVASDHILYQVYDVTRQLRAGENALGLWAGDGWYASGFGWRSERYGFGPGPRRVRAQLVIDYADGQRETVATGPDWRIAPSPILASEIYNGEAYDARAEQRGWDAPRFDDHAWAAAARGQAPNVRLVAQPGPKIRAVSTLEPKSVIEPRPGVFVYDFGQNFAGWCRLKVSGPAGQRVTLRFAEILKPSGEIDTANLRHAKATDSYVLRGDPQGESFEPRFTYHGFRYVEVSGYPGRPPQGALTGIVAHSDAPPTGRLVTDNALVQEIWTNALWSQRSNFFGVPTDCPQRDERMGWMGDIQVFLDAAAFNMDVDGFIRRFLLEVRAGQTKDGGYPIVTPQPLSFPDEVTAGWSEAGVILPWTLWRRFGDTAVVEENWPAMSRWMAFVGDANPDLVWRNRRGLDLGDWLSVDARKPDDETTPRILCATAYWAYCAELMSEMAHAIGRKDEAERYARLRDGIGKAFAAAFVQPDGQVGNGSQTSYVLGLRFGLVPEALRATAAARLAADIRRRGMRLSTGFLGTPYLLDVLADHGQTEVAVGLLLQTDYPSWGYMIRKGATTMWERWNGDVGDVAMNSYNHYAFGAVVGFLYRRLAAIAPAEPGFRRIEVRPLFDVRIGRVKADYDSRMGRISTEVDGDASGLTRLTLVVPPNATARVALPVRPGGWREGGRQVAGRREGDRIVVDVGAGAYRFQGA
jgi:alpha-L-rhamnosidase